jgi:hypothetical protein
MSEPTYEINWKQILERYGDQGVEGMQKQIDEDLLVPSSSDEILKKVIEAVDILNLGVGTNRMGGLVSANKVGTLLNEAWEALEGPE